MEIEFSTVFYNIDDDAIKVEIESLYGGIKKAFEHPRIKEGKKENSRNNAPKWYCVQANVKS